EEQPDDADANHHGADDCGAEQHRCRAQKNPSDHGVPSAAVYEYGCQAPSGVFSGGANCSRRWPRAASQFASLLSPLTYMRRAGPLGSIASAFRSAGVRRGPGARPEQPSIRVGPATAPNTFYRVRVERPARPQQELTHRTNGAFTGSPGGTTAALAAPAC